MLVEVAECFMWIDTDGDGIAEFKKIRVAGDGDNPSTLIDMVDMDIDDHPFGACTAIMMSHKHYGQSFFDRLHQVQAHKTSLFRNIQDNIYLQNNQRIKITPGVNIDDMMTSRPGGLCRMNALSDAEPLITPPVGQSAYQMLDYLDKVMSGRVGVSPDAQMKTDAVGSNVGSEGVGELLAAKDELLNLMVRVIAETAIKPMMIQIRDQLRKHMPDEMDFKFRSEWVKVRPSEWTSKRKTTVRVGTGSGNDSEQRGMLGQMMLVHEKLQAMPGQVMSGPEEIYNTIASQLKMHGINDVDTYLKDPASPEGEQAMEQSGQQQAEEKQKREQMEMEQLGVQKSIAQAEVMKAQAAGMNVELKGQIEDLKLQLARAVESAAAADKDQQATQKQDELAFKQYSRALDSAEFVTNLEVEHATQLDADMAQNKSAAGA
jgi:hypothetical protein